MEIVRGEPAAANAQAIDDHAVGTHNGFHIKRKYLFRAVVKYNSQSVRAVCREWPGSRPCAVDSPGARHLDEDGLGTEGRNL